MSGKPSVRITYCTQCNWLLRAAWIAQELLSSFGSDLAEVMLVPGTGGIYEIYCDDELIWERKRDGGFPEAAELKRRLRDKAWPEKQLGHVDGKAADTPTTRDQGPPLSTSQSCSVLSRASTDLGNFDRR